MTVSNAAVSPPIEPPDDPQGTRGPGPNSREARALIGWMPEPEAEQLLLQNGDATRSAEDRLAAIQSAQAAVAARAEGTDQADLVEDRPADLDLHVERLKADPAAETMFAEGWDVAVVDLRKICAFQPVIFSEDAVARVEGVNAGDINALALIALPTSSGTQLPLQFDKVHQAFILSSSNPNLRIVGATSMPVGPQGVPTLGFGVGLVPSFVQLALYRGRYYLRDGYHRCFGFLSRGIYRIPAFVRELTAFEELLPDPRTMLPQDAYRGSRPPLLTDYLDEVVSARVRVPGVHKMILVQAQEFTPAIN